MDIALQRAFIPIWQSYFSFSWPKEDWKHFLA